MDSQNILSILSSLGADGTIQPPPANVLQAMAPPAAAPAAPVDVPTASVDVPTASDPVPMPAAPPVAPPAAAPAAPEPAAHPHKRLSVIDTIGRLADVFARVGGAQALYQPMIEANQDRALKLGDHAREVDMDGLKRTLSQQAVDAGALAPQLDARKRLGTALSALAGQQNAAALWPDLAAQAGITDPQQVAQVGAILAKSPDAAGIFAKALGATPDKLGKNVYFGTDPDGKTVAYQVGPDGNPHILDFSGAGITPNDPIKVVDTGNGQAVVGGSGTVKRIIPKGVRPDTMVTTGSAEKIAAGHDRTNLTIAGMPARAKAGSGTATGDNSAFVTTARGNLDELRSIYGNLKKSGAMVSPTQSAGANLKARLRSSGTGQLLEGTVGTEAQTMRDRIGSIRPQLMQSLAKATGMTGKQLDSNADVKLFMQTVTDPTKSYEANIAAIDGLDRFLKANTKKAPAAPAGKTPVKTITPRAQPKSGWSIVKVQ